MRWNRSSINTLGQGLKVLGATLFILMFMVWQHVEARRLERWVETMRKEEDKLVYLNARMQSQINQWLAPSHLESMARKELGMIPLDAKHRIGMVIP
ncbi:MAG: hypothetical protein A2992_08435 [Elusimicrobia bacterium RIFCSPLOWO2_01_FULL_59_12]|nr:MAG: hypothetical protein A2992_08435 [Elusimicrobia bacterium RIFCSPLOWO2_01_FULL_59_12]